MPAETKPFSRRSKTRRRGRPFRRWWKLMRRRAIRLAVELAVFPAPLEESPAKARCEKFCARSPVCAIRASKLAISKETNAMRDVQLSPTGLRTHSQVLTDIGTVLARAHKETVSLDERALLEKF